MTRQEVEAWMKARGMKTIDIYIKPTDTLAKACSLKGGKLYDYTNHVACGIKDQIDGYIKWIGNGDAYRISFTGQTQDVKIMEKGKRIYE